MLLVSSAAAANVLDLQGFGPRAIGMSGAVTADANDYSAVVYNPALLTLRTEFDFGLSVSWLTFRTDVAPLTEGATLDCTDCRPADAAGVSLGLLFPLAGKVQNRVAIGAGLYVPVGHLSQVSTSDPSRPFWYLYDNNPERILIFAGLGVRIVDELRLGVGLQILAALDGNGAQMQVDLFSKQVRFREVDSYLDTRAGPTAGLSFAPFEWLRFGLNYRSELGLSYRIPADIELTGIGTLRFDVSGVVHYSPHQLSLGAAYDLTDALTFTLDGTYSLWSKAPTPYVRLMVDVSGETLRALGLDEALDLSSEEGEPSFSDTLTGRLGVEYRVSDRFALRGGAFLRPTHVPRQDVEGTNILDGTTYGFSAGLMVGFADPLEVFQKDIRLELAGHAQFTVGRQALKEPTDSVPSYGYSARVFGLSGSFNYAF